MPQRGQIIAIQYLRAVAALMVVAHHGREQLPWLIAQYPYKLGQSGVDIFFVISGFVMIYITSGRTVSPAKFLADRITRIVPLYWIATLVMLAAVTMAPSVSRNAEVSLSHIVLSLLFIFHATEANTAGTFLIVGWTLNYEMLFYVLLTLALLVADARHRILIAASALIFLVALGAMWHPSHPAARAYTDEIMLEFILGMMLAHAFCSGWMKDRPATLGLALLLCGALGIVVGVTRDAPQFLVIGIPAAMLVAGGLILEQRDHVKPSRLWLLLADSSYAIYLFNLFAIGALKLVWAKLGLPITGWAACVIFLSASMIVGTASGVLAHVFIERPLLGLLREPRQSLLPKRVRAG